MKILKTISFSTVILSFTGICYAQGLKSNDFGEGIVSINMYTFSPENVDRYFYMPDSLKYTADPYNITYFIKKDKIFRLGSVVDEHGGKFRSVKKTPLKQAADFKKERHISVM